MSRAFDRKVDAAAARLRAEQHAQEVEESQLRGRDVAPARECGCRVGLSHTWSCLENPFYVDESDEDVA